MRTSPLISVLAAVLVSAAHADEPRASRAFASADGRYELVPTDSSRATWTLWDRRTGEARYEVRDDAKDWWRRKDPRLATARVPGELASQTVLVSDDGSTVVVLNDWPESLDSVGGGERADLPWLRFFRDGILVKAYRRSEFLRNDCSLSESVSHYRWLLEPVPKTFPDGELVLTTTELTTFRFDVRTGAMLGRDVPGEIRGGALLIMGAVRRPAAGKRVMVVERAVLGAVRAGDVIDFEVTEGDPLTNELDARRTLPASVLVADGKLHPLSQRILPVLFNGGGSCR